MGDDHHVDVWWNNADNTYAVRPVEHHDPNDNDSVDHHPDHDDS